MLDVDRLLQVDFFETSYLYYYLHIFTVVPVVLLSFDKKVAYYKKWKYLFPSIFLVGIVFIIWDVAFTEMSVWGFNESYFSNLTLLSLPLEEWLFFINVPLATVFIYECLNSYIKKDLLRKYDRPISITLSILFILIGVFCWDRIYTATTFLLSGGLVLYHFLYVENSYRTRYYLAYMVSNIPFLLVNGVLTGGYTSSPVVIYNPEEYLGYRIGSVPMDDMVYSFLLFFLVIIFFEYFQKKFSPQN